MPLILHKFFLIVYFIDFEFSPLAPIPGFMAKYLKYIKPFHGFFSLIQIDT